MDPFWIALVVPVALVGLIVYAVRRGRAAAQRRREAWTSLGLVIGSDEPFCARGEVEGKAVDVVHVHVSTGRRGFDRTSITVLAPSTWSAIVQRKVRDPGDASPPGGGMRRIETGDPTFDGRFDTFVASERDERLWADTTVRQALLQIVPEDLASRMDGFGGPVEVVCSDSEVRITLACRPLISNVKPAAIVAAARLAVSLADG